MGDLIDRQIRKRKRGNSLQNVQTGFIVFGLVKNKYKIRNNSLIYLVVKSEDVKEVSFSTLFNLLYDTNSFIDFIIEKPRLLCKIFARVYLLHVTLYRYYTGVLFVTCNII